MCSSAAIPIHPPAALAEIEALVEIFTTCPLLNLSLALMSYSLIIPLQLHVEMVMVVPSLTSMEILLLAVIRGLFSLSIIPYRIPMKVTVMDMVAAGPSQPIEKSPKILGLI